ncbi:unnamed protein product [Musa acuminata var. zebrina]
MSIVRRNIFDPFSLDVWDPFKGFPFDAFRSLSETRPGFVSETSSFANTRIDWKETPEAHVFKADLPGVKKEEVKVEVEEGRVLQISGERSKEEEEKSDKWHRVERSSGKFLRRFRLPENAMVDQHHLITAMSIVRRSNIFDPFSLDVWDPFQGFPFDAFRSLAETRPGFVSETSAFANTRIDWKETPEAHVFKADLPGVKKEEVKVEVEEGRVVQISGERSKEKEEKSDNHLPKPNRTTPTSSSDFQRRDDTCGPLHPGLYNHVDREAEQHLRPLLPRRLGPFPGFPL